MARISYLRAATFLAIIFASRWAVCQQSTRPYDGIQAGVDAYQLGEERRQANVGQQLYLNDLSRARLTPLATYGYGYRPFVGTFGNSPAALEYAYGYSNSAPIYGPRAIAGNQPLSVFAPWPYVPGDIWGDLYVPRLRQPIAQLQIQTGPNRWESHPVYNPSLTSRPVLPPVNSPALMNTPYASETSAPTEAVPSVRSDKRRTEPEPPSPGPSKDDDPSPPRRRVF
jgi:hypothetical protein